MRRSASGWMRGACVFGMGSSDLFMPGNSMKETKQRKSMSSGIMSSKTNCKFTTRCVFAIRLISITPLKNTGKDRLSWAIWLWKDIGFQGMVYTSLSTPYMKLFSTFLAKKHRLAVDAWGADDSAVKHVYQPLIDHIAQEVPEKYRSMYPAPVWAFPCQSSFFTGLLTGVNGLVARVGRLSRSILVTEHLIQEWADHFIGKSVEELDEIAASFKFENCEKRDGLNKILTDNAKLFA